MPSVSQWPGGTLKASASAQVPFIQGDDMIEHLAADFRTFGARMRKRAKEEGAKAGSPTGITKVKPRGTLFRQLEISAAVCSELQDLDGLISGRTDTRTTPQNHQPDRSTGLGSEHPHNKNR